MHARLKKGIEQNKVLYPQFRMTGRMYDDKVITDKFLEKQRLLNTLFEANVPQGNNLKHIPTKIMSEMHSYRHSIEAASRSASKGVKTSYLKKRNQDFLQLPAQTPPKAFKLVQQLNKVDTGSISGSARPENTAREASEHRFRQTLTF